MTVAYQIVASQLHEGLRSREKIDRPVYFTVFNFERANTGKYIAPRR